MVNGPPPPDGPWRRGSPPAPDILCWDLFISFSPPHTKSFYISTFLHLKSSWSRCFFFAKIYYLGKVPTKCRPSGRCFGVHLFEIFREKIRYFENFDQWSKYCRCRMGDHEVRVFAHHWSQGNYRQAKIMYKLWPNIQLLTMTISIVCAYGVVNFDCKLLLKYIH